MFSLARRRREAERRKKLEEVFSKADSNGNGKITAEQMVKIFEENEVQGKESFVTVLYSYSLVFGSLLSRAFERPAPAAFWVALQLTSRNCALIALQFTNQSYVQVALMLRIWNCAPTCAPICAPRSNLQTTLKVPVALLLRF